MLACLATAAPFSHKIHLEQKLTCAVCHAAASKSTAVEDNLLPSEKLCAGCHKDENQVKAPRQTLVSKFDHARHAKMDNIGSSLLKALQAGTYLGKPSDIHPPDLQASNACVSCHRGLERSEEVSPDVFPRMADCLVCHDRIDPPFSCEQCHNQGAALKPASHTNDWLDRHTSSRVPKDKQSCAVCHGRRFTCLGCH